MSKALTTVDFESGLAGLSEAAAQDIGGALRALIADMLALYLKTKNFHWHMTGPLFRDYHLLLDEHGDQLLAMIDPVAERCRKIGARAIHSLGHATRLRRIVDNDADHVDAQDMLAELWDDNRRLVAAMRETHGVCDEHCDVATASLLENWIDEGERRIWFLRECVRGRNR